MNAADRAIHRGTVLPQVVPRAPSRPGDRLLEGRPGDVELLVDGELEGPDLPGDAAFDLRRALGLMATVTPTAFFGEEGVGLAGGGGDPQPRTVTLRRRREATRMVQETSWRLF
jgi:hypothetical protein